MTLDLVIAGSGPAALALANAAVDVGMSVGVVAPGGVVASTSTLALFDDETAGVSLRAHAQRAVVRAHAEVDLGIGYGVIDGVALANAVAARVRVTDASVVGVDADAVRLDDGRALRAHAVVDATGAAPALVALERGRAAHQVAYGLVVEGDVGIAADTALLMDWSDAAPDQTGPPSFLYGMPLGADRFLVEETSLCARPAVDARLLERRLHARLRKGGARIDRVLATERVLIPMGQGLPRRGQRVAAFGAALGAIHPATGYSVARSLALAPTVASVIARALEHGATATIGDAVLDAVWHREARARRALFALALEAACRFTAAEARGFFQAFFTSPRAVWRGFLDGSIASAALRVAMAKLFARVDARTRMALARGALTPASLDVIGALFSAPHQGAAS